MGVFIKQIGALLVGKMAGSNNKAAFIVKTLRTVYIVNGTLIAVVWYSAYRNERVAPGEIKFPFPGWQKLARKYAPDRPEKELEPEEGEQWGTSVGKLPKSKPHPSSVAGNFYGVPQTPDQARALQGLGNFEGERVANWIIPYLTYARKNGWKGAVNQGFRTYAEEVQIARENTVIHAAPGTSNHGKKNFPGGAVDVEEPETLDRILKAIPGGSLLKWAGPVDTPHFSYPHNGGF